MFQLEWSEVGEVYQERLLEGRVVMTLTRCEILVLKTT